MNRRITFALIGAAMLATSACSRPDDAAAGNGTVGAVGADAGNVTGDAAPGNDVTVVEADGASANARDASTLPAGDDDATIPTGNDATPAGNAF